MAKQSPQTEIAYEPGDGSSIVFDDGFDSSGIPIDDSNNFGFNQGSSENSFNWNKFGGDVLGAFVGGGLNILGNWIDRRQAWKYYQKQMALQNQYRQEWFDKTNAYNSKSAQRSRDIAAGFNPALLYGGSGAGASVSASSADTPTVGGADMTKGNPIFGADSLGSLNLISSQVKKNLAEANESESRTEKTQEEIKYQQWMNTSFAPMLAQMKGLEIENQRYQNFIASVDAAFKEVKTLNDLGEQILRMGNIKNQAELYKSQKQTTDKEREHIDALIRQIDEGINLTRSQVRWTDAKTQTEDVLRDSNKENIDSDTANKKEQRSILRLQKTQIQNDIYDQLEKMKLTRAEVVRSMQALSRYLHGLPENNHFALWEVPSAFMSMISHGVPAQFMGTDEFLRKYVLNEK